MNKITLSHIPTGDKHKDNVDILYILINYQYDLWYDYRKSKITKTLGIIDNVRSELTFYKFCMDKKDDNVNSVALMRYLISTRSDQYKYVLENIKKCCKWR
jgi:hypothetical protein